MEVTIRTMTPSNTLVALAVLHLAVLGACAGTPRVVPVGSTSTDTDRFLSADISASLDIDIANGVDEQAPASANATLAEQCVPQRLHVQNEVESNSGNKLLWLGVVLELCSCVFSNFGLLMEKRALLKEEERVGNAADVASYKLPMWWAGFVVFAIGQVISGVAMTFTTVVVIAPLGSFALVVNIFSSYLYAKEPSSALQVCSSLLIVAGCALTTIFAPWHKASNSLECFRVYMASGDFHLVAAILLSAAAVLILAGRALVVPSQSRTPDQTQWSQPARLGRWLYPIAAGMTAVWTINVGAVLMRLLAAAFGGSAEIMKSFEIYTVVVVYLCLIIAWQRLMNDCMIVLNAAFVVPINFALFTMLTLPLSGSLHGTLSNWHPEPLALTMYVLGTVLSIVGMCGLLESEPATKSKQERDVILKNSRAGDDTQKQACDSSKAALIANAAPYSV
jgi:drug/metabolite transporter (DMT)-like permease